MALALIVREPFGGYNRGDEITDSAAVARIVASEDAANVIKTAVPDSPEGKGE